tara:strand:- start:204 stop:677 length:474 start_codon:yes stop_codon:yes gene_type:complete
MSNNYINFYNNLIHLTRNKKLYNDFTNHDTFSDRLVIFLFHFAFFLNIFKSDQDKKTLQNIFDYIFKQLETSIREIGYGDASINKKMKNYVNVFYSILQNIENWDNLEQHKKIQIFQNFLNIKNESSLLINYFDNYRNYIKKSTFNSLLKGVIKLKF